MRSQTHIEAPIRYYVGKSKKIVNYACQPPPGVPRQSGIYDVFRMQVENGRTRQSSLTLDDQGLQLVTHETEVTDFYDPDQVLSVYYLEVEELVKTKLGAEKVVAFDHNVRCALRKKKGDRSISGTTRFAHNDYTLSSGAQRLRDLLGRQKAAERLKLRVMQITMWRPIRGPIQESPLAVCDARSLEPDDLVDTDLVFEDRTGKIYTVAHNPNHRWIYFPQMQATEALLMKGYDSLDGGQARFTAHTGFDDPTTPIGALARESIEVRTFVFLPK